VIVEIAPGRYARILTRGSRTALSSRRCPAPNPLGCRDPPRVTPRVRAALAFVAFFVAIGAQSPYLVLYYQSLGFDLAHIGQLVGLAAAIGLLASPAWGAVSDRFGGSPLVLLTATVVGALGAVSLVLVREPLAVAVAAIVLAIGIAGTGPILDARALEAVGPDRTKYGPLRAWGSVSYIASAFLTGAAIERWGLGVLFAVLAVALLSTGLIGLTLRPEARVHVGQPFRAAGRLFGRRGLGLFLVGAFLTWSGLSAVAGFYSIRLHELGAPATVVGLSAALGAAIEVPIMLRFPRIVARFGASRVLVAGAACFAGRALLASLSADPTVLVALSAAQGVGFACFMVGGVTYVSEHAPRNLAATAQGIFQGAGISLAQVTAAAVGGSVAGLVGVDRLFLLSAGLGTVATAVVAVAVWGRMGAEAVRDAPLDAGLVPEAAVDDRRGPHRTA